MLEYIKIKPILMQAEEAQQAGTIAKELKRELARVKRKASSLKKDGIEAALRPD